MTCSRHTALSSPAELSDIIHSDCKRFSSRWCKYSKPLRRNRSKKGFDNGVDKAKHAYDTRVQPLLELRFGLRLFGKLLFHRTKLAGERGTEVHLVCTSNVPTLLLQTDCIFWLFFACFFFEGDGGGGKCCNLSCPNKNWYAQHTIKSYAMYP